MDFPYIHILQLSALRGGLGRHSRKVWDVLIVLLFALVFVVLFSTIVPYNMDEFLFYDTILCHLYPGNNIHNGCDPFQLNVLGTGLIAPLRSYHYVGSFPALYFLPIVLVWSSPLAARLLGMVFLMAGGFIAARAFSFRPKPVIAALILTFPYLFQHLVDTGPIGVQIFFVYLLYVLLDRWCASQRWGTIGAITLITFCGIWTKPSFFWFAPGLVLFLVIHIVRHREQLKKPVCRGVFLRQGAVALVALGLLLATLFLSTAQDDSTFRPLLEQLRLSQSYDVSGIMRWDWLTSPALYAFLHPLEATQRIYEVMPVPTLSAMFSMLHYLFVPVLLLLLFLFAVEYPSRKLILPAVLYVSFLLTIAMVVRTRDSWAMHHAILSYPFLILSVLATLRCVVEVLEAGHASWPRTALQCCGVAFFTVNLLLFMLFPTQTHPVHTSPQNLLVQRIINTGSIPGRTMVLTLDWGMFYYAGLFGSKEKSVLFEWGLDDPERVAYLQSLSREHHRKIVVLFTPRETSVNMQVLTQSMHLERCAATPPGADWVMLSEPDAEIREVCARYAAAQTQPSLARRLLLHASLTR